MERRLFVSFSGGATSAFMAWACLHVTYIRSRYDSVRVVFANTGLEHPRTLAFVKECDDAFRLGVEWVEADIQHRKRMGTLARVVSPETASRQGEPFREMIRKYGIPNTKFPHCTRELKQRPLHAHMRSTGLEPGTYDTAIGIRVDEIDRMASDAVARRIVYPLVSWLPMTKQEIGDWWRSQPFSLGLPEHLGNCVTCWKKSERKLLRVAEDMPDAFDFTRRMEDEYARVGSEFERHNPEPSYRRTFFRGNRSTDDLLRILHPSDDTNGCGDSCEVDAPPEENPA